MCYICTQKKPVARIRTLSSSIFVCMLEDITTTFLYFRQLTNTQLPSPHTFNIVKLHLGACDFTSCNQENQLLEKLQLRETITTFQAQLTITYLTNPPHLPNQKQNPNKFRHPLLLLTPKQTRGVSSHCGLAIYIKKNFKAKEVLHATGGGFSSQWFPFLPPCGPPFSGCQLTWTLVLVPCFFSSPFLGCFLFIKFDKVSSSKEELQELKYFTIQKYNLQKIL